MTEDRKQELRQLLQQMMESVRIVSQDRGSLPVAEYGKQLRQRWASYSAESRSVKDFTPSIVSNETTSKLYALIRSELGQFVNEDRIVTAISYAMGGSSEGVRLSSFLTQLLKIAIARGTEEAVLAFDRRIKDTHASIQCVALLEKIKIEEAVQVFEGVRLVPVPDSPSVSLPYLPRLSLPGISEDFYHSQTLLIVDYTISPMFHKPVLPPVFLSEKVLFRIEVRDGRFSYFTEYDFFQKFCCALSLVCNFPVQIPMKWDLLPEDAISTVGHGPGVARYPMHSLLGKSTDLSVVQIEEAKGLYGILANVDSNVGEKLKVPIHRWIQSKVSGNYVDQVIDLGIALEALYLSDIEEPTELSFRLRLHAAWHLAENKEDRKALLKEFREIYAWRSSAVHKGKLPNKKKNTPFTSDEKRKFIERAQDLCRASIMKILENGVFPDWNNLILDGEAEN